MPPAVLKHFRGPNEALLAFPALMSFLGCIARVLRAAKLRECATPRFVAFMDSPSAKAALSASRRVMAAMRAVELANAEFGALVLASSDRRWRGLSAAGNDAPANSASALRVLGRELTALHGTLQQILDAVVADAEAADRLAEEIAAGRARFVPGSPAGAVLRVGSDEEFARLLAEVPRVPGMREFVLRHGFGNVRRASAASSVSLAKRQVS